MDIPWERQNTLVHAIEILVAESKLFMHLRQVESIHELRWLDQGMLLKSYLVHSMAWYVGISKPTEVIQVSPSKPLDCQRKHRPKENSQPMTFPSSFTQKSCLRKKDFNSSLDWWAMTLLHSEVKNIIQSPWKNPERRWRVNHIIPPPGKDRWRNPQGIALSWPLYQKHLLGVAPSTFTTVSMLLFYQTSLCLSENWWVSASLRSTKLLVLHDQPVSLIFLDLKWKMQVEMRVWYLDGPWMQRSKPLWFKL